MSHDYSQHSSKQVSKNGKVMLRSLRQDPNAKYLPGALSDENYSEHQQHTNTKVQNRYEQSRVSLTQGQSLDDLNAVEADKMDEGRDDDTDSKGLVAEQKKMMESLDKL